MNLLNPLQDIVKEIPGRTAREYSKKLQKKGYVSVDESKVNSIFDGNSKLFESCEDNSNTPRWFLKNVQPTSEYNQPLSKPSRHQNSNKLELYSWQKEALAKWKAQHCQGVVEAVTGAGKTRVGISAAIEELEQGGFVLVIVPSLELLRQWEKTLKDYLPKNIKVGLFGNGWQATFQNSKVIISTVNAARKCLFFPPDGGGLLIADECHRYGSECNKKALDERFEKRLGLSATYQRNDNGNADFLEPYFGNVCFEMDYKRAISDGVISKFSIALIGVTFSSGERMEYDEYSKKIYKLKNKLIYNFGVVEEPFGEFMKEVSLLANGGHEEATFTARWYMSIFKKRQKLLAESPSKINGLLKLIDAIRDANRTLIFTQTIESVESITANLQTYGINAEATHSKMNMDERKQVLQEFEDGDLEVVVAPRILDEGIDVPEADLAIIIAASKTRRQMIQRMGRVLRLKKDGRIARFALFFIEETSEDPSNGAHETFIDEITEVAVSVKKFGHHSSSEEICPYLSKTALHINQIPEKNVISENIKRPKRNQHSNLFG